MASSPDPPAGANPTPHLGLRVLAGVAGPLAAVAAVGAVVPPMNAMAVTFGLLAAVLATARFGWRTGAWFGLAGVVTVAVATLASPVPVLAALWMLVVGAGVAPALRRGVMPAYLWLGIATGFVVVAPQPVATADKAELFTALSTTLGDVAVNAAAGLAVGAAAVGWLVVLGLGRPRPPGPVLAWAEAVQVAVVVAVATSVGTLVVLQWYRVPLAAWFVLTVYVVSAHPEPGAPLGSLVGRAAIRVAGTVLGVAVAVGAAVLVPVTWVLHAAAVVLFVAGMYVSIRFPARYWWYVVLLTAAVVLADSDAGTAVSTAEYRLGFTLAGVAAAVAVVVAVRVLTEVITDRAGQAGPCDGRASAGRPHLGWPR